MKNAVFVILCLAAMPLAAQNMNITGFASQVEMQGENEFDGGLATEFDDGRSMGVSVNRFFGNFFAVEGSVFNIRNDAALALGGDTAINLGNVDLTPVMLGAQVHLLGRRRIDPYVGAGVAYVLANDLNSPDLELGGVGRVEMEDAATYYVAVGVGVEIAGGFALVAEGRQLQYEPSTTSTATGVERDLELSPQILSLGLRFRF